MMASTPMQSLRWDSGKRTAVKAAGGLLQRFGRLLTAKDAVAVVKEHCGQDPNPKTVQQRLRRGLSPFPTTGVVEESPKLTEHSDSPDSVLPTWNAPSSPLVEEPGCSDSPDSVLPTWNAPSSPLVEEAGCLDSPDSVLPASPSSPLVEEPGTKRHKLRLDATPSFPLIGGILSPLADNDTSFDGISACLNNIHLSGAEDREQENIHDEEKVTVIPFTIIPCEGHTYGFGLQHRKMVSNHLQSVFDASEEEDDFDWGQVEMDYKDSRYHFRLENEVFVVRSPECEHQARESFTKHSGTNKCSPCQALRSTISSCLARNSRDKRSESFGTRTRIGIIAKHSDWAETEIRKLREAKRNLAKENYRLTLKLRLQTNGVEVTGKMAQAVCQVFEKATVNIGKDDRIPEDDKNTRDFLQVYYDHLHKNQAYFKNGGKKSKGVRFDPLLLNFSLSVLSKTSTKTYQELSKVMCLPSLSHVSMLVVLLAL
jgi:hypothetical protein